MIDEDNKTLWCGNLPEQVTEELLYELFLQAGPLEKVRIPRDRDGRQKNFAFITYCHEVSVPYAMNLFRGTALFHRTLTLQCRGRMALLPPPIRCYGPDPSLDFVSQGNVIQQFAEMTEKLREDEHRNMYTPRHVHDLNDKLVQASLQGNWSHRHHPYRPDKNHARGNRDNHNERNRDNHNDNYHGSSRNNFANNNWRDRRNPKKGNYHRRD
ncbi:RNA-binding protein 7 [Leguminivora glycinivorella]|uniref:RNA-binding protein 7 n=1 Tax=Leguminivora glycinivorella TaxID=1035111 RepID=UPI00200E3205|nr:RNA-binding protein 7 [Leguminivora glycinivorella]